VVLLYFYVAELAFPRLGISSDTYDSPLRRDKDGRIVATDAEREAARARAVDDRRREGADDLVDGAILAAVGLPTMIWHLRRGRRVGVPASDA
jgi:hypothetical protein